MVIVGAGALGREVYEYAEDSEHVVRGFVDDDPTALDGYDFPVAVLCPVSRLGELTDVEFVVAVGDCGARSHLAAAVASAGGRLHTIVHPTSYVSSRALLAEGTIVGPFAFVGTSSSVGPNVVLNTYASVGHDATVEAHGVLSPYAVVNGGVVLSDAVFLGTHATVAPRLHVGRRSKVGAGAVVTRDVAPGALALGNPAKTRVMFDVG